MKLSLRSRPRLGSIVSVLTAGLALTVLVGAGLISSGTVTWPMTSSRPEDPMTNHELAVALSRTGLSAESLAAAGATAVQTTALVDDARSYLTLHVQEVRDTEQALADAKFESDRLERKIQAGLGTQEDLAAYATAKAAAAAALAARDAELADFYTAAAEDLSATPKAVLSKLKGNTVWDVLPQYRAADRTQAEWVALRDALANKRIAEAAGGTPDEGCTQLLATADADPAVSAAKANLDSKLAEVTTAWNAAVYGL